MKNYTKNLLTIMVPCYNHEKFLGDFFDSVLAQTYSNIELIICDDCSLDNSFDIIKRNETILKEKLSNVIVLRNDVNLGIVKTLNKMIKISNGEFIKIIASDDMLDAMYCSEVCKTFSLNHQIDVVVTNGYMVPEETNFLNIDKQFDLFYKDRPDFSTDGLFERMYRWNRVFAPGTCYRANVYEKYGQYDESILIEDWEYSCRLAYNGCEFLFIDTPLCYYRTNQNSASSKVKNPNLEKRRIEFFKSEMGIIEKYGKYVDKKLYVTKKIIYIFGYRDYAKKNNFKALRKEVRKYKYSLTDIFEYGIVEYFILVYRNIKGRLLKK